MAPSDNYTTPPSNNNGDGGQNRGNANEENEPADTKHANTTQEDKGGQQKKMTISDAIEASLIMSYTATKDISIFSPREYESNESGNKADT